MRAIVLAAIFAMLASDHAADRIAELTERGDRDGAFAWRKIRAALLDLSDVRFRGDAVN